MRATTVARWAAWVAVLGFVVAVATFGLSGPVSCPGSGFTCSDDASVWRVLASVGALAFAVGVPVAVAAALYDALATPP